MFSWRQLTSDGAEGVEVFGGEQRSRKLADELLEQRSSIVWTHVVPVDLPWVEVGLQVLLQQLHTENNLCCQCEVSPPRYIFYGCEISCLKCHSFTTAYVSLYVTYKVFIFFCWVHFQGSSDDFKLAANQLLWHWSMPNSVLAYEKTLIIQINNVVILCSTINFTN